MNLFQSPVPSIDAGNELWSPAARGDRPQNGGAWELRLPCLQYLQVAPRPPDGVELPSLAECGNEWLLRRVYNQVAAGPGFRRARVLDVLVLMRSPAHDPRGIFMARVADRFVGICVSRLGEGSEGRVCALAVAPEYRSLGIGRALLRRALLHLQEHGAHEVRLCVAPDNHAALVLYGQEGFLPVPAQSGASASRRERRRDTASVGPTA